jgi:demethoxyubiquinone hydroxylase (CLK1/Coq7/Cat5 family)
MKVSYVGEHCAVSIYACQIFMARFIARSLLPESRAFKVDEPLERRGLK